MFNRYSYGNNNPYRFTDPDGRVVRDEVRERLDEERRRFRRDHERFALEEGSPSNVAKRNAINDAAVASEGSTDWARDKEKTPIRADLDKCNLYPYDIANSVGATFPMKDTPSGPRLYRAAEIADPSVKIKNWRVLGPNETPQGGDIGAYATPAYRITSGHAGVIVRRSGRTGGITTMSTSDDSIVEDDDHIDSNPAATFRRYEGD